MKTGVKGPGWRGNIAVRKGGCASSVYTGMSDSTTPYRIVTQAQLAQARRVTPMTIYRWTRDGKLPPPHRSSGGLTVGWRVDDLPPDIAACLTPPTKELTTA